MEGRFIIKHKKMCVTPTHTVIVRRRMHFGTHTPMIMSRRAPPNIHSKLRYLHASEVAASPSVQFDTSVVIL